MHVTVIGAGVAGLACAVALAEHGARVEVLERASSLGRESCSWQAGGMLAPWCEAAHAEPLLLRLAEPAIEWWSARLPATVRRGTLVVAHARDVAELTAFARRTQNWQWLDAAQLAELEPALAGRFSKALYFHREAHLDPRKALACLAERVIALGGHIHFDARGVEPVNEPALRATRSTAGSGQPPMPVCSAAVGANHAAPANHAEPVVSGFSRLHCAGGSPHADQASAAHDGGARTIVDCTGMAAHHVLSDLRGVRGEMVVVRSREVSLTRPVRVLHPRIPLYVVPRGAGVHMVGATTIESEASSPVTVRSAVELLNAAYALHPAFGEAAIIEMGAGVRPAFADNLPRIRRQGRTYFVNGFYRHGFLLAPALAEMTAQAVLHGRDFPEVMDEDHRQRRLA